MSNLSTGIGSIDRRLDGGFSPGSLVALVTPPAAQSHDILRELIRERPTLYLTTLRSASVVEADLNGTVDSNGALIVRSVGDAAGERSPELERLSGSPLHAIQTTDRDPLLDDVHEVVKEVTGVGNVIVDPANPLERTGSHKAYEELLRRLTAILNETGSLGLLHCPSIDDPTAHRETTLTAADAVWELEVATERRDRREFQTRIPKNRGGDPILENVSLIVQNGRVGTDDSRAI